MLWKVVQNALLTKSRLMEMGFDAGLTCLFCDNETETTHHLFLQCTYTMMLFDKMMQHAGCNLLSSLRAVDLDMIYKATRWRTMKARCLTICLKKYMSIVWLERNLICFEKKRRDGHVLWEVLKKDIYQAMMLLPSFPSVNRDVWR